MPRAPRRLWAGILLLGLLAGGTALRHAMTGPVVRIVAVGLLPASAAVDEHAGLVYVSNNDPRGVSLLDARDGRLIRTAGTGAPARLAPILSSLPLLVDARTDRVFVVGDGQDQVSVLDATTGRLLRVMPLPAINDAAVDEASGHVFVIGSGAATFGEVYMLDARGGSLLHTEPLPSYPASAAADPSSHRVFTVNYGADSVSMLDSRTGRLLRTVAVGRTPVAAAVDEASGRVFVANSFDRSVTMLDARSGAVLRTIPVGIDPVALAVDVASDRVFVVNAGDGSVSVLEARGGAPLATISAGALRPPSVTYTNPALVAVDETARRVFVLEWAGTAGQGDAANGRVIVLDAATGRVLRTIAAGRSPIALAVDKTTSRLFVVSSRPGDIGEGASWVPAWARNWLPGLPAQAQPLSQDGSVITLDIGRL